jgi:conjugative transfer signal peptidase TraF
VFITGCLLYQYGLRFNITTSLPVGFWKIDKNYGSIKKGDYVWFTPTKAIADFGIKRGYLPKISKCQNNTLPLLKCVYGLPGDTYSFNEDRVCINDNPVENIKRRKTDSKGRKMPVISNDIVPKDQLFVLTLHSHSYDSRYYGTIPIKNIEGTAKPIFVWN